ncbi:MAG: COX15/CtaA family protein [Rhodothermales bacterium]
MTTAPSAIGNASLAARYRARHRFSVLVVLSTIALLAWGAFVTSIDAGLAVPDWPTSFNSYDLLNPIDNWWTVIPFRAEHGHRLLATVVGLLTIVLVGWTLVADERRWMRYLSAGALGLIIFQGVLGGLRVIWISLDLAVVHACVAQIFFSTLVAITLFTSRAWFDLTVVRSAHPAASRLRGLAVFTAGSVYLQIILGALLRHPGTGIDVFLATTHMAWAFVVSGLIVVTAYHIRTHFRKQKLLMSVSRIAVILLGVQFALGLTAYLVNLDEAGYTLPSHLQVIVNTSHMVTGALLMAAVFCQLVVVLRGVEITKEPSPQRQNNQASDSKSLSHNAPVATV